MARLNAAYAQKDLNTLRRLVDELTDGRVFSTAIETISDQAVLEKRLSRLLALKAELLTQIETIEQDEAYLWMTAEGDVQERLMVLREELSKQKEALICAL